MCDELLRTGWEIVHNFCSKRLLRCIVLFCSFVVMVSPKKKKPAKASVSISLVQRKNPNEFPSPVKQNNVARNEQKAVIVNTSSQSYLVYYEKPGETKMGSYLGDLNKIAVEDDKFKDLEIAAAVGRVNEDGLPLTTTSSSNYGWYAFVHCVPSGEKNTEVTRKKWALKVSERFTRYAAEMHAKYQETGKGAFKFASKFIYDRDDTPKRLLPLSYYVGTNGATEALQAQYGGPKSDDGVELRNNPFEVLYDKAHKYFVKRDIADGINQYLHFQGTIFSSAYYDKQEPYKTWLLGKINSKFYEKAIHHEKDKQETIELLTDSDDDAGSESSEDKMNLEEFESAVEEEENEDEEVDEDEQEADEENSDDEDNNNEGDEDDKGDELGVFQGLPKRTGIYYKAIR